MNSNYFFFLYALCCFVCCRPMNTEWENYEQAKKSLAKIVTKPSLKKIDATLKKIIEHSDLISNDKQLSELLNNIVAADTFLKNIENEKRTGVEKKQDELDSNPIVGGLYFNEKKFVMEITHPLRIEENNLEKIMNARMFCWQLFFETKKALKNI